MDPKRLAAWAEVEPEHEYVSTACHHNRHDECRQACKFCAEACRCACHGPYTDLPGLANLPTMDPEL